MNKTLDVFTAADRVLIKLYGPFVNIRTTGPVDDLQK